jgi:hypothetical protein
MRLRMRMRMLVLVLMLKGGHIAVSSCTLDAA